MGLIFMRWYSWASPILSANHRLKLNPHLLALVGTICFSSFLLLPLLFRILNDPLLQKKPRLGEETMLVPRWAICLLLCDVRRVVVSCGNLSWESNYTHRYLLWQLEGADAVMLLLLTCFSFSVFFLHVSSDYTDRPDCSQNQGAGFPGLSGLSGVSDGCLLCW